MKDFILSEAGLLNIQEIAFYNLNENKNALVENHVKELFPQCKSIITVAYSYNFEWNQTDSETTGYIARYTTANFYRMLSKKLRLLGKKIKDRVDPNLINDNFFRVFVNSKLNDKTLSTLSNLGKYANNSLLFIKDKGVRYILGELLINFELESTKEDEEGNYCNNCNLCVEKCPTKAIDNDKFVNKSLCLQHLSTQMELPFKINNKYFLDYWKNRFFGCTECVDVCPYSKKEICYNSEEVIGFIGGSFDCSKILEIKKQDYKIKFAANQLSASWIKEVVLARNSLLSLSYTRKNDIIKEYMKNIDYYGWNEEEKEYLRKIFF